MREMVWIFVVLVPAALTWLRLTSWVMDRALVRLELDGQDWE